MNRERIEYDSSFLDEEERDNLSEVLFQNFVDNLRRIAFVVRYWNANSTHSKLTLSTNFERVVRSEYFEIYPLAISHCSSRFSAALVELQIPAHSSKYEFSLGFLQKDIYQYDLNLALNIGSLNNSWGLVFKRDSHQVQSVEIWESGKLRKEFNLTLRSGARVLSILLPRLRESDLTSDHAEILFCLNDDFLWSFREGISLETEYSFGICPCPNLSCELVIPSVSEILNRVKSIHESDEKINQEVDPGNNLLECQSAQFSAETVAADPKQDPADTQPIVHQEKERPPVPHFFPSNRQPVSSLLVSKAGKQVEGEQFLCCVCLSDTKSILLIPCNHLCLCQSCGGEAPTKIEYCPICRVRIKKKVKVFL